MTRKYGWIFALLWCFINVAVADTQPTPPTLEHQKTIQQTISQAITDIVESPRKEWQVQISHYENEEGDVTSSIERYTPDADITKKWSLLSINGKKPNQKQLKKFAEDKQDIADKKSDNQNFSINLQTLIKQDSLELKQDNDSHIKMGFQVEIDRLGDDAIGKLEGTLSYNKADKFIEQITIINNDDFSPMFSATISDLMLSFNFIKIEQVILPSQSEFNMKGSFAYFTEIDEISTVTYSNYQHKSELVQ